MTCQQIIAYVAGIVWLLLLIGVNRFFTGSWNMLKYCEGKDGRPSTSKFQFFLITFIFLFGYVVIQVFDWLANTKFDVIDNIPSNVLIAMGLSATTALGSKGITVGYMNSGKLVKKDSTADRPSYSSLLNDDSNVMDFSKFQMLAWTILAGIVYIVCIVHNVQMKIFKLPDIEPSLAVLMGIGQGTYLGKKLVTTGTPRLQGLTRVATTPIGINISIKGDSLGDGAGDQITLNNAPIANQITTTWNDSEIAFTLPLLDPSGKKYQTGQVINIGVIVNGTPSANTIPFTWS